MNATLIHLGFSAFMWLVVKYGPTTGTRHWWWLVAIFITLFNAAALQKRRVDQLEALAAARRRIALAVTTADRPDDDRSEGAHECRICRGARPPLIKPCACLGSLEWVHSDCLQEWLLTKSKRGDDGHLCEICKRPIRIGPGSEVHDGDDFAPSTVLPPAPLRRDTDARTLIMHIVTESWHFCIALRDVLAAVVLFVVAMHVVLCIGGYRVSVALAGIESAIGDRDGSELPLDRLFAPYCPAGLVDITDGAPNYWECGRGCAGGAYTDGTCCCACQLADKPHACIKNRDPMIKKGKFV